LCCLPAHDLEHLPEGKEHGQAWATWMTAMVVVENDMITSEYKEVVVTKVLQTAAGRMIPPAEEENEKEK
jgi:uncharacterized protein YacL